MSQWYHLEIPTDDLAEVANIITVIAEVRKRTATEWEVVRLAYKRHLPEEEGFAKVITWEANDE